MKRVERSALLPYSAQFMFGVVNDVARYAEFLPWCDRSEVLIESPLEMMARVTIAKAGVRQSFTTRNTLDRPNTIVMSLIDGPFRHLSGRWQFRDLGADGSKVSLNLTFDFNSALMNLSLGKVFEVAADTMVDAFSERAKSLLAT